MANQHYFGLEALALRAGAERVLARIAAQDEELPIDVRNLAEDFRLDPPASISLLRALLAGGLLHPDGSGGYSPTSRLREYALACVVAPLSRARAKGLIKMAHDLAARVNAGWTRHPFQIETIAVSGSFMSLSDPLPELSLWVVPRPRLDVRGRGREPPPSKSEALREIRTAMNALSSFIVVRIVPDRQEFQRPFCIVFQASEDLGGSSVQGWERLRDWHVSITRRLGSR